MPEHAVSRVAALFTLGYVMGRTRSTCIGRSICVLTWQDVWKGEYVIDRSMCKLVLHTYIMTVKRWGWVYKALSRTELDSEHCF